MRQRRGTLASKPFPEVSATRHPSQTHAWGSQTLPLLALGLRPHAGAAGVISPTRNEEEAWNTRVGEDEVAPG